MPTILAGDCLTVLPTLAAESVQCVVTSPPFFNLRNYQTGHWIGGDPACDHVSDQRYRNAISASTTHEAFTPGGPENALRLRKGRWREQGHCLKCGAEWIDKQLGLEATPELFVEAMVRVFREVHRVLKSDGVCFLNLGDTYSQSGRGSKSEKQQSNQGSHSVSPLRVAGMQAKQLLLIPARVALALQSDGWILRNDIIIAKRNPMPESVKDRCTRSHEHLFVLTKQQRYYWDCDAIREPATGRRGINRFGKVPERHDSTHSFEQDGLIGANARDVWLEPSHYHKLINGSDLTDVQKTEARRALDRTLGRVTEGEIADFRMKIAGVHRQRQGDGGRQQQIERDGYAIIEFSGHGAPPDVWRASDEDHEGKWTRETSPDGQEAFRHESETRNPRDVWLESGEVEDVWWQTQHAFKEAHFAVMPLPLAERCIRAGSRPGDTILDPFGGAGTTALAAQNLGRNAVLIELNGDYIKMAKRRLCLDNQIIGEHIVNC